MYYSRTKLSVAVSTAVLVACLVQITMKWSYFFSFSSPSKRFEINSEWIKSMKNPPPPKLYSLNFLRKFGETRSIPAEEVLEERAVDELNALYHSYLDNTDILCGRKLRMGGVPYEDWEICDDEGYRPERKCLVYSLGSHKNVSFESDASNVYGCHVFLLDLSTSFVNATENRYVSYTHLAMGEFINRTGRSLQSRPPPRLQQLRAQLNHSHTPIDILKLDMEHLEWDFLPTAIKEEQLFDVRQLLVEYHGDGENTIHLIRRKLNVLRDLEKLGFRRFFTYKNPTCFRGLGFFPIMKTNCYTMHYLNTHFRRRY